MLRLSLPIIALLNLNTKNTVVTKRNLSLCMNLKSKNVNRLTFVSTNNLMSTGTLNCKMHNRLTKMKYLQLRSATLNFLSRIVLSLRLN